MYWYNYFNSHKSVQHREKKIQRKKLEKIPDASNLVTTTVLSIKISEIEKKYLTLVI